MIIASLESYYVRARSAGNLPPLGWMNLPLDYILIINEKGEYVSLMPNFEMDGSKRKRNTAILPAIGKQAIKHTNSGEDPNLLWDNAAFVIGLTDTDATQKDISKSKKRLEHFTNLINTVFSNTNDVGLTAIRKFYNEIQSYFDKILKSGVTKSDTITFKLNTDSCLLLERPAIFEVINNYLESSSETYPGISMIDGSKEQIALNHYSIKNVRGTSSDGPLVAFNDPAYESYGAKKGAISPVGNRTMIAYTTALNHLLRKGSEQRFQVGDASTIFWSGKKNNFENDFATIWGATSSKDDPDKYTNAVKAVFKAVDRGLFNDNEGKTQFYVLGLSPSTARIAVRFYIVGTIREFAGRIKQHFEYLQIIHNNNEPEYLPLYYLLKNIAVQGESKNIPPNLGGEVMQSILTGRPYPCTLFAAAIRRCKAEQKVNYQRAAIIKAYLNRAHNKEDITVMLNKDSNYLSYQLGRLFAVLEKTQEDSSNGKLNETIRNRYYSSASSNPIAVFSTLCKLTQHHISKMEKDSKKKSWAIVMQKEIQEIMSHLPDDKPFPATFNLEDQGRFAVGYYHQRQEFFAKKSSDESGE